MPKKTCKTCGRNCEGEYCFQHKPRKPLPNSKKPTLSRTRNIDREAIATMNQFFLGIWRKRRHYSEVSGKFLGNEPLTVFFHHILPKEKFPQAQYDEDNIILLTFDEHTIVENDMYRFDEVNERRKLLKHKYERA